MKRFRITFVFVAFFWGSFAIAGPTLTDLIPGKYECNFNDNMIIEITDDRQVAFEIPRNTIATDLMLDKVGLALGKTKVRGHLSSPPEGYDAFHAFAVEQKTESYGTIVSVEILTPTRILVQVPTKDFGEFLGVYEIGGCEK